MRARVNARTHTSHNNPSNQRSHTNKQADNGPTGQTVVTTETAFKALEHTEYRKVPLPLCCCSWEALFTQVLRWLTHSPLHPSATRHFSSSAVTSSARLLYKGSSDSKNTIRVCWQWNYFRAGDGSSRPRGGRARSDGVDDDEFHKVSINDSFPVAWAPHFKWYGCT